MDPLSPEGIEQLRRSIAMLTPGQVTGLKREQALELVRELQRLRSVVGAAVLELRQVVGRLER